MTLRCLARSLVGGALFGGLLAAHIAAAATTTVQAAFDGRQPEMPQRVLRDGTATMCPMEPYPGTVDLPSFYQTFVFCNGAEETCFTTTYLPGTCDDEVHLLAYVDLFDPTDLDMNYAGDLGTSLVDTFSFVVPAGRRFQIVAHTNFGMPECTFGFTVDAMRCTAAAPALSGPALALAACALFLAGAAATRRSPRAMVWLILCAVIVGIGGAAAAPTDGDPTPTDARTCGLSCSAEYKACAHEQCDSGAWDKDPECLVQCRRSYDACREACR